MSSWASTFSVIPTICFGFQVSVTKTKKTKKQQSIESISDNVAFQNHIFVTNICYGTIQTGIKTILTLQ